MGTKVGRVKKQPERFKVIKSARDSLFLISLVQWKKELDRPLLVSVARTSGPAVLRNRWKRLVKNWFYSEGLKVIPGQSVWIRYNRTKSLNKILSYQEWSRLLHEQAKFLS